MILEPLRIRRDDLRTEVRELVDLVCHDPSGHQLPVTELVRILGITVKPAFHQQLASRGELSLEQDRFINQGPQIRRKVRLVGFDLSLHIAPHLRGRLMRFQDSFQLSFEPDHSVVLSKFFFRVELRHLDLNPERIFIDFAGAQDVFIELT